MTGERTLDVSRKHGLTPARISQLRRDFHDDWERFGGSKVERGLADCWNQTAPVENNHPRSNDDA